MQYTLFDRIVNVLTIAMLLYSVYAGYAFAAAMTGFATGLMFATYIRNNR